MTDPVELLSMDIPCTADAPAIVRRALGAAGWEHVRLDDSMLVASELVTNAVLHSGCETDHRIQVHARVVSDGLLISVHDPGFSGQDAAPRASHVPALAVDPSGASADALGTPQPATTGDARVGGWGLRIVDQLARRWGAERPDGYRVWAELALAS